MKSRFSFVSAWVLSLAIAFTLTLAGCGGNSNPPIPNSTPSPTPNAAPSATAVSPTSATAGAADTPITVTGSSFVSGSVVNFNSAALSTTFVSGTQLNATIPAAALASGSNAVITVTNPGGTTSSALAFTVKNPAPTVTSATMNAGNTQVTVSGSGFVKSSLVEMDGAAIQTNFGSSTSLFGVATFTSGSHVFSVSNPGPGGGNSAGVSVTIGSQISAVPTAAVWRPNTAHGFRLYTNGSGVTATADQGSFLSQTWSFDSQGGDYFNSYLAPSAAGTYHVTSSVANDPSATAFTSVVVDPNAPIFSTGGKPASSHKNFFTATLLGNNTILIAGGDNGTAGNELLNTATGTFGAAAAFLTPRMQQTANVLINGATSGDVLFCGGVDKNGTLLKSCELYDPSTNTMHPGPNMGSARKNAVAVMLQSGKILIAGGDVGGPTAEVYDAVAGTFTATGPMAIRRFLAAGVLLASGKVLVTGGDNPDPAVAAAVASSELYDPATNSWTSTGSMVHAREGHILLLLPDGRVAAASQLSGTSGGAPIPVIEAYDPATGKFSVLAVLQLTRTGYATWITPTGKIGVYGGTNSFEFQASAEICDPAIGQCVFSDTASTGRDGAIGMATPLGTVYMVGGATAANTQSTPVTSPVDVFNQ